MIFNYLKATGNINRPAAKTANTNNPIEDDFITNLQKQIYYLELEMKLMKDREVETKNKIGGYGNENNFYFLKQKKENIFIKNLTFILQIRNTV